MLLARPALHGSFLMDDFVNLAGLKAIAASPDLSHILQFTFSGISSELGRPLSLFTFALQAASWPQDPYVFKYVNLALHLLNGCLLLLLWLRLSERFARDRHEQLGIALSVFALWLVHPLQVTAVVYVIQRMTELAATFTLLGLLGYLHGRQEAAQGRVFFGGVIAAASLAAGGLIAILAKETGILILVYALVLEFTLFDDELGHSRLWAWWRRLCLYLPVALFVAIIALRFDSMVIAGYGNRSYGMGSRLLTEPRVVWSYIVNVFSPSPHSLGLFHDDFRPSTGLFTPWTTLPSVLGIIGLAICVVWTRRRWPVLAFGLGWFLGGQLLESTIFPLELYFEHRNYLPLAGLLTIAAFYLPRITRAISAPLLRSTVILAAMVLVVEIIGTSYVTYLYWGHPLAQARIWAQDHPDSVRAQIRLARQELLARQTKQAFSTLHRLTERKTDNISAPLARLLAACDHPDQDIGWAATAMQRAPTAPLDFIATNILNSLISAKEAGLCRNISSQLIDTTLVHLLQNPAYRTQYWHLHVLRGRLWFAREDYRQAVAQFDAAYRAKKKPEILVGAAQRLLYTGHAELAAIYYRRARAVLKGHPLKAAALATDMRVLRESLDRPAKTQGHSPST